MTTPDSLPELEIHENGLAIPVTAAERLVLEKVKTGEVAKVSTGRDITDPAAWSTEQTIRSPFLRHLCLHPDRYGVDVLGIAIEGALITGPLNLEAINLERPLSVNASRFAEPLILQSTHSQYLSFSKSYLPGLKADRLRVEGNLILSNSRLIGETRLLGVYIGTNLQCNNSHFINLNGAAFNADRLTTKGDVFLNNITVQGETRLIGADIGGNIECTEAHFLNPNGEAFIADALKTMGSVFLNDIIVQGRTRLMGANIGGDLNCSKAHFENPDGYAFMAQRLSVKARFFWTEFNFQPHGTIDLGHASVGDFVDDGSGWPETNQLLIDGFCYDHLGFPTSATDRCKLLSLMRKTLRTGQPVFWPQPYEQLIKVFRNAGHDRDARQVAIAKQEAYRKHLRARAMLKKKSKPGKEPTIYVPGESFFLRRFGLWVAGWSISYGYESWRALVALLGTLILGVYVFAGLDNAGLIEPAKERIYTHPCYINNTDPACQHWTVIAHTGKDGATRYLPPDYPAFNAFIYSLDVLLPIVDLKLEDHWMASSRSTWGRFYFWLHIAMGWVFTTIAVAGFTGLIKKD